MVQQTGDGPRVRRVLVDEAAVLMSANSHGLMPAVDLHHPEAARALGGSANGDVFMHQLGVCHKHMQPVNAFVPTDISQVFNPSVVQGTLEQL